MEHRSRRVAILGTLVACGLAVPAMVGWPRATETSSESAPETQDAPGVTETGVASSEWFVPEGWWGSAEHGVALEPPPGWTETSRQNRAYLDRVAGSPADGNFCVITLPNMRWLDMDGVQLENLRAYDTMPGLELVRQERAMLDGQDVLQSEFIATHQATGAEYHCRSLVFLRGGDQVILTLTIAADQWDDQLEVVEAAFDSLVLAPR